MTVGLYLRVSSEMQEQDGYSLKEQERLGVEYAHRYGYDYIIYKDNQSGSIITRPEFQRLITDVENLKVHMVWVMALDRIARSSVISGQFRQLIRDYRIPLIENGTELNLSTPIDSLNYGLRQEFSEYERMMITERMSRGRDNKYSTGGKHIHGLWGYDRHLNQKTEKSEYTINEGQAKIIREIINRVIKGESYNQIRIDLDNRGIKSPRGNEWRVSTIASIARQKMYAGYYDYKDKINIKSYLYPPIIDWETHLQAKKATESAIQRKKGVENKTRHNHHMLTTLFDCHHCGGSIYFNRDKKVISGKEYNYEYYKFFHTKNCNRTVKHQTMFAIDAEVWLTFQTLRFLMDKDTRWRLYENRKNEASEKAEYYNDEIENLETEIKKIKNKKTKLLSLDLDDEQVINEIQNLSARQKEIEKQKRDIEITLAKQDEELEYLLTELMKDSTEEFLQAEPFVQRKMLMNWMKAGYVKDNTLIIEWITGKVDKLENYRKVFKTEEWKNFRKKLVKYPLMEIYHLFENAQEKRNGGVIDYSAVLQDGVDKGLLTPIDKKP